MRDDDTDLATGGRAGRLLDVGGAVGRLVEDVTLLGRWWPAGRCRSPPDSVVSGWPGW
jgi:hypothetical protein